MEDHFFPPRALPKAAGRITSGGLGHGTLNLSLERIYEFLLVCGQLAR